jgi:hypothetical protein
MTGDTELCIPKSVLALLRHHWKDDEPDYSAFESIFFGEADEGSQYRRQRQIDPSYYFISQRSDAPGIADVTYAEAAALHREQAWGGFSRSTEGHVTVNEHAMHALHDFCRAVYVAWRTYQERLAMLDRVCMPIGRMTEEQRGEMHRLFEEGGRMSDYKALLDAAKNADPVP